MGRKEPKKKKPSFLISYNSLFTMFPQMWINEINYSRGAHIEDKLFLRLPIKDKPFF